MIVGTEADSRMNVCVYIYLILDILFVWLYKQLFLVTFTGVPLYLCMHVACDLK